MCAVVDQRFELVGLHVLDTKLARFVEVLVLIFIR